MTALALYFGAVYLITPKLSNPTQSIFQHSATSIWDDILSGERWQSLPDWDASCFPGSCQSKRRHLNPIELSSPRLDNHQTQTNFFFRAPETNWEPFRAFSFAQPRVLLAQPRVPPRTSLRLSKCLQYTIKCVHCFGHNLGIMFWKDTHIYLENLCILRGKFLHPLHIQSLVPLWKFSKIIGGNCLPEVDDW